MAEQTYHQYWESYNAINERYNFKNSQCDKFRNYIKKNSLIYAHLNTHLLDRNSEVYQKT